MAAAAEASDTKRGKKRLDFHSLRRENSNTLSYRSITSERAHLYIQSYLIGFGVLCHKTEKFLHTKAF